MYLAWACFLSGCHTLTLGQMFGIRAACTGQGPTPAPPCRIPIGWAGGGVVHPGTNCILEGLQSALWACPFCVHPFLPLPPFSVSRASNIADPEAATGSSNVQTAAYLILGVGRRMPAFVLRAVPPPQPHLGRQTVSSSRASPLYITHCNLPDRGFL